MDFSNKIFRLQSFVSGHKRIWSAFFVLLAILFVAFLIFRVTNKVQVLVELPIPESNLYEKQTFQVLLKNVEDPEKYKMLWSVDEGILSGEMVFKDYFFEDVVDVGVWDWKKDNSYNLSFKAFDQDKKLVASQSMTVYTGEIYSRDLFENESIVQKPIASVNGVANVKPNETLSEQVSTQIKALSIEWIKAPDKESQKFVFNLEGYSSADVNAFWQVESGHRNFIFETDSQGRYVVPINFSGWHWLGNGPYPISFIITDKESSEEIAREEFELIWDDSSGESKMVIEKKGYFASNNIKVPIPPINSISQPAPIIQPVASVQSIGDFSFNRLFVQSKPAVESSLKNISNRNDSELIYDILSNPSAIWLNGDGHDSDEFLLSISQKATLDKAIPVFVLYNIPNRDCGSHSSGGADEALQYKSWIDRLTRTLSGTEMMVVVEPDALAQLNCLSQDKRTERVDLINYAVSSFSALDKAHVYIDAGHPFWVNAEEMANRLKMVSVDKARGFALNVSNFISTEDNIRYGNYLSSLLGGKKYVVDTSRNGRGPDSNLTWCNPMGRGLGQSPEIRTSSNQALDAFLWIKYPGESDGTCNGGPTPGIFWLDYALTLARNRV